MTSYVPVDQLDSEVDHDTLYRLSNFLLDELTREREASKPRRARVDQLHAAFNTVIDVSKELRARGSLRSPTMFSAVDDPTVTGAVR